MELGCVGRLMIELLYSQNLMRQSIENEAALAEAAAGLEPLLTIKHLVPCKDCESPSSTSPHTEIMLPALVQATVLTEHRCISCPLVVSAAKLNGE